MVLQGLFIYNVRFFVVFSVSKESNFFSIDLRINKNEKRIE